MISDEDEIYLHTNNRCDNSSSKSDDEWGFDDDDIIIDGNDESDKVEQQQQQQPKMPMLAAQKAPPPSIYKHLSHQDFIEEMSAQSYLQEYHTFLCKTTLANLNEKCFSEISSSRAAAEDLRQYYLSRPQLFSYTLNTELHRMDYTVKDGGSILTNADDIRSRYETQEELLIWRAANQSLLADAIQCLTGPDKIIRPHCLATAVANKCHFILDMKDNAITCDCNLLLSLPMEDRRLEVAELQIQIYFYLDGPELYIQLVDLTPTLNVNDHDLLMVSRLLTEQGMMNMDEHQLNCTDNASNFRDAFTNTTTGMSHTLRQMEKVVNVKGKLGFFRNLNALLPSADLLAAVEEDAVVAFTSAKSKPVVRPPPPPENRKLATTPLDNLSNHRPKPLLGGMVRNLTTKLSSASTNSQVQKQSIRLYNLENETKSHSTPPPSLRLYNIIQPSSSPIKLHEEEEAVASSGWSDDESDYLEEDDLDPINNNINVCASSITKVFDQEIIILDNKFDIIPTRKRWNRCAVMIR